MILWKKIKKEREEKNTYLEKQATNKAKYRLRENKKKEAIKAKERLKVQKTKKLKGNKTFWK